MGLRLIIEDDEGATTIVPLASEPVTIGRQDGNTIKLTEKNVSRQHAELKPDPGGWIVQDLDSYNGVKVNGVAITAQTVLVEGDVVQIGDYYLALSDDVDKKTLNIERPDAANQEGPFLASSSAALPHLSAEDMAELNAGRSAPRFPDPGAELITPPSTPVSLAALDPMPAQGKGGGNGALVAVLLLLAGVGGFVAMNMFGGKAESEVAASKPAPAEPAPVAEPEPEPEPTPVAEPEPEVVEEPEAELEPEPEVVEEPEPEPEPEAESADEPSNGAAKKKKGKKAPKAGSAPAAAPEPTPTPAPAGPSKDGDQLLADARKASMKGNHAEAYALAKEALGAGKGSAALNVMGVAACKMGDAAKAKAAYKKLSGANKEGLQKVCGDKGIEL